MRCRSSPKQADAIVQLALKKINELSLLSLGDSLVALSGPGSTVQALFCPGGLSLSLAIQALSTFLFAFSSPPILYLASS